jgi:hypothetical protein
MLQGLGISIYFIQDSAQHHNNHNLASNPSDYIKKLRKWNEILNKGGDTLSPPLKYKLTLD